METIIPINIAPRASRPRSATESRAPFAIEAREERITLVEEFEEFRLAGMCDRPAAAACEKQFLFEKSPIKLLCTIP